MLTPSMSRDIFCGMSCKTSFLIIAVFWGLSVPKADCQDYVPFDVLLLPFLRHLGDNVTAAVNELKHNTTSLLNELENNTTSILNDHENMRLSLQNDFTHTVTSLLEEIRDNLVDIKKLQMSSTEEIRDTLVDIKKLQQCSLTEGYSSCPSGWRKFQGSCYHISQTEGTWDEGRAYCKNLGGDYVKISSREESDFIFTSQVGVSIWIGLNDLTEEGTFRWISDDSVPVYTNWRVGEPSNSHGREDCVHHYIHQNIWNDMSCSSQAKFACEINLPICERLSN